MVYFDLGNVNLSYGGQLPADLDGPAPPAGTPNYFAQVDDIAAGSSPDQFSIWEFHVDWNNPANSTFGLSGDPNVTLATAPFDSRMCFGSQNCIPQPGGTALDAISDRLMHRLQYRNFGGYPTLVTNHTVDVDGTDHAGVRWYELRRVGGSWSIYQQGTYAPDADHRWMGSAALDATGNLAVGYSVSSATVYPSIRYAGRLAGDSLGTLPQGEGTLINGTGYQTGSAGRWGDYSMLGVDPTDGCTFWFTSEYYAVIGAVSWQTRIGSFKFSSCSPGPQGALKGVVSNAANAAPLAGAVVQASSPTQSTATQSAATGAYTMTLPVGAYTVTTSLYGYLPGTVSNVSVMSGTTTTQNIQLTAAPSYAVSGTIRDATTGWPLYASLTIGGYPGGTIWNNPVTGFYSVTLAGGGPYIFNASAWAPGYLSRSQTINPLSSNRTLNFGLSADVNACTAPGYEHAGNGLFERFETQALPSGWSNGEGPAAACYNNKIYVMGGSGANRFFIYDIATDTWSTGPALPRNVWGAAAGAWNGRVYLIGGDDDFFSDNTSNRVDIYDIAANAWLTTTPAAGAMPTAAVAAGFVQAGPNLYVAGGWGDASPTENVTATQRYNMQTNTWTIGPTFTSGRADFALAMTDQALYAIGGDADGGTFLDATEAVHRLSLTAWPAGMWTVVGDSIPAAYLSNSAGFCTSGIAASEVWSVGGLEGDFFSIVGTSLFRPSSTESCYSIYSDVPWVSEAPASGGVSADSALSMTINFDAANLSAGLYRATLTLATNDSVNALVRIPVTLTVNAFSGGLNLTPAAARMGQPGATVTYTLLVTNTGNALDTFSIAVGGNQWTTTAPATVGPVASGASAGLPVTVTVPANQVIGTSDVVTVTVTSQSDNAKSARAVLTTTAGLLYGVAAEPPSLARAGKAGTVVTYTLTVINTGSTPDQYDVTISGAAWTTTAPTTIGPLAGGASARITVTVAVPGEAEEGRTDTAALTVTSRGDETKLATSVLTTTATAMPFRVFLPVVRR